MREGSIVLQRGGFIIVMYFAVIFRSREWVERRKSSKDRNRRSRKDRNCSPMLYFQHKTITAVLSTKNFFDQQTY